MSTVQVRPSPRLPFPTTAPADYADFDCTRYDTFSVRQTQFDAMSTAFRQHGGFVSGDEVSHRLRRCAKRLPSTIEHWIACREILNVWWRDQTLMPMFQFDLENMSIRPACAAVVDELKTVFDDWELSLWFATPNIWLADAVPAAVITVDRFAVLQAARADRFIARG